MFVRKIICWNVKNEIARGNIIDLLFNISFANRIFKFSIKKLKYLKYISKIKFIIIINKNNDFLSLQPFICNSKFPKK